MKRILPFVSLLLFSCSGGTPPNDSGVMSDTASDVATPLTADEMALVGTWQRQRMWAANSLLRFTITFRADRTSTLLIEDVLTSSCGVAGSANIDRPWHISNGSIIVGSAPQCSVTLPPTCTDPMGAPPLCNGPPMGGTYTYSINGTSLTLTSGTNPDDGTYTRQ